MDKMHVFDLHCDTLDALAMRDVGYFIDRTRIPASDLARNDLALDLDRMRSVAAWAQCLAIFIPDDLSSFDGDALAFYRRVRDYLFAQAKAHSDKVEQVRDARKTDTVLETGKVAGYLTVEGGAPIGHDLGVIDEMAEDGVKMLTLTWNGPNTIASGHNTAEGLSSFGRKAVRALEERRIVVDVSHLNDVGFWDLEKVARRPFAASHSNARPICGHLRNLTDDQFRAITQRGGIVGLNYYTEFLSDDAQSGAAVSFDDLSRHIDHFLHLGGEECISLGSDFDGCTPPDWLRTCEDVPAFRDCVAARFGEDITERLFYTNARDFFVRNETL